MKKGKKKKIIFAVAGVAVLGIGLKIYSSQGEETQMIPQVTTVAVEKGTVAQQVDANGTIVSDRQETYFSPVRGRITRAAWKVGDSVSEGTKLVEFDVTELEAALEKAKMNQQSGKADADNTMKKAQEAVHKQEEAKAQVAELEQQVKQQEENLSKLKEQLGNVNVQAQVDARNAASAQAAQAQAQMQNAKDQAQAAQEQALQIYQQQTLPEYEMELGVAEFNYNEAAAAYSEASAAYDMAFAVWQADQSLENGAAVDQALQERNQAEVNRAQAQAAYEEKKASQPQPPSVDMSSVSSDIQSGDVSTPIVNTTKLEGQIERATTKLSEMQSELASKKAIAEGDSAALSQEEQEKLDIAGKLNDMDVEEAQEMVEKGREGLTAQFDGVISKAQAVDGAAVTEGMELYTVVSTEDVSVDVNISKYDFDKLKEGQKAEITMGDRSYQGTVSKINRIASTNEKGTAVIEASVKIDNPDENIFIGVDAKVKIHANQAKDVLVIPSEVVNIGKEGSFCYVLEDGIVVRKDIVTGLSSSELVEVKEGLQQGDQVIADMGYLMEGDAAQAIAPAENGAES